MRIQNLELTQGIKKIKPSYINITLIDRKMDLKEKLFEINRSLRTENGLYVASTGEHYRNYVWLRDVFYQVRPNLKNNPLLYVSTYHSILDYLHGIQEKYDNKIDHIIDKGRNAVNGVEFIHPRFYTDLTEITPDWGNIQIDTIGYILKGVADGLDAGLLLLRDDDDISIIEKLISVLKSIEYWHCADNGIWEESVEVHASSIGAALGGLIAIQKHGFYVPDYMFTEGREALEKMLPDESLSKGTDLALLTLIWPFNVLDRAMALMILDNCRAELERENGFIRYSGDKYYNLADHARKDEYKSLTHAGLHKMEENEAEWSFGFLFAALSYNQLNHRETAEYYLRRAFSTVREEGVPELYYSKTNIPNGNNPLGWATAMMIVALDEIGF